MSALFNFHSLLLVLLLVICTSTYAHGVFPGPMDRHKGGILGVFWKCARIGERLSPYVSLCCVAMAVSTSSLIQKCNPTSRRTQRCMVSVSLLVAFRQQRQATAATNVPHQTLLCSM